MRTRYLHEQQNRLAAKHCQGKKVSNLNDPAQIGPAIKTLVDTRGWSQRDLAHLIGVTPGAVSQWIKGTVVPTPMALMSIGRVAGKDKDWWFAQAGDDYAMVETSVEAVKARRRVNEEHNRTINIHGSAGAGPNRFVQEEVEDKISLPRRWFAESQHICGLWVRGDSMAPLIPAGYLALIDVHDNKNLKRLDGKIIACRDDHGVAIKRLREIRGAYFLVSNNLAYPEIEVRRDEHSIVGTVIRWISGSTEDR